MMPDFTTSIQHCVGSYNQRNQTRTKVKTHIGKQKKRRIANLFTNISIPKNSKHSKEFTKLGAKKTNSAELRDTKSTHTDKLCFYKPA